MTSTERIDEGDLRDSERGMGIIRPETRSKTLFFKPSWRLARIRDAPFSCLSIPHGHANAFSFGDLPCEKKATGFLTLSIDGKGREVSAAKVEVE